jgi:hypothetical protein
MKRLTTPGLESPPLFLNVTVTIQKLKLIIIIIIMTMSYLQRKISLRTVRSRGVEYRNVHFIGCKICVVHGPRQLDRISHVTDFCKKVKRKTSCCMRPAVQVVNVQAEHLYAVPCKNGSDVFDR